MTTHSIPALNLVGASAKLRLAAVAPNPRDSSRGFRDSSPNPRDSSTQLRDSSAELRDSSPDAASAGAPKRGKPAIGEELGAAFDWQRISQTQDRRPRLSLAAQLSD